MKTLKILKIEKDGFVDLRRIIHEDYKATKKEFKEEYNIILPELSKTPFAKSSDVRILLSHVLLKVHTDSGVMYYWFKPGYITDLASIPKKARSFIDNDDISIILAALKHDGDFRWHFRSFTNANEEFLSIMKLEGASWWQRFWTRLGIYTSTAKQAYFGKKELDRQYKRVNFEWRDK